MKQKTIYSILFLLIFFSLIITKPSWSQVLAPVTGTSRTFTEKIFGLNGANVVQSGETWNDLSTVNSGKGLLIGRNFSKLSYAAGSTSNFWDFKTGWFLRKDQMSLGIDDVYASFTYLSGDKMEHFKLSNHRVAGNPIFDENMLTSDFYYQLASLYHANEVNLPIKDIELGKEFYNEEVNYKTIFNTVNDYATAAENWATAFKNVTPFAGTKIAAVGA